MNKELISLITLEGKKEFIKNTPSNDILFDIAHSKGQELAKKLNANQDIVALGTALMDYKIADAIKMGKLNEHIKMSAEAGEQLLLENNISSDIVEQIKYCIESHHGSTDFKTIEAEICANADCYKFIHPKGFFSYLITLGKRLNDFGEVISQAESKLDEKFQTLSIDHCKEELSDIYFELKKLIKIATQK